MSSPSDVAAERGRVKLVADRFNAQLEGIVRLEVLRWEDAFYTAAHSFQEAIDGALGNMAATDMVLCIVWKRAGLKLNPAIWRRSDGSPYESGTVLEFETAIDVSRKQAGTPDVFLFRKSAPVVYDAERVSEQLEQYELLQSVWKRWTESEEGYNTAGYQSFADPDDFEAKLTACLRQWLERKGVVAHGPNWDRKLKGSPFRGLAAFEASHAAVFFGREAAIARAVAKLRQSPFLLVIGASGSGKSSLLRAGLIPRATAPGVIADVDLWRTAVVNAGGDPFAALAEALFADDALGAELRAGDFSDPMRSPGCSRAVVRPRWCRSARRWRAPRRRARRRCATRKPGRRDCSSPSIRSSGCSSKSSRSGSRRSPSSCAGWSRAGWQASWRCCVAMPTAASRPFRRSWRCSNRRARASICCRRRGPNWKRSSRSRSPPAIRRSPTRSTSVAARSPRRWWPTPMAAMRCRCCK